LKCSGLYWRALHQVQFVAGMTHAAQSIYVGCAFPLWMQWALILYGASILALFINFYFQSYIQPSRSGTQVAVVFYCRMNEMQLRCVRTFFA